MDRPIRLLLANRPRFMRELILTTFSDQSDIEVVDEVLDEADIPSSVERTNPDFIIITQETLGERPSVCDIVLHQRPHIRIIAIVPHQKCSVFYWASVSIYSREIEASEEALLNVVRSADSSTAGAT